MFLEISQNSQENTSARVSFFNKVSIFLLRAFHGQLAIVNLANSFILEASVSAPSN